MERVADSVAYLYDMAARCLASGDDALAEAHFNEAQARLRTTGAALEDVACLCNDWADQRAGSGRYDVVTEAHYARALELLDSVHGSVHPDVANVLNNLAALAQARGRYPEAERHSGRARQVAERILASIADGSLTVDPDTTAVIELIHQHSLAHLATALRSEGRYAESEVLYREALRLAERQFSPDSREAAAAHANLGVLCKYAGRYDEAAECYRCALAIIEKSGSGETLGRADLLYNLGGLAHARGRFKEAEPFAREAVALSAALRGDAHPDYGIKLGALAAIVEGLNRHQEAEGLYRQALAVLEQSVGQDHPDVALTISNLGTVAEAQGKHEVAEVHYRRALQLREKNLGAEHPQVALTLDNLCAFLRDAGRYAEAEDCYRRALALFERYQGPRHPHTLACREGFSELLDRIGETGSQP